MLVMLNWIDLKSFSYLRSTFLLQDAGRSDHITRCILFPSRLMLLPLLSKFSYPFLTRTSKKRSGVRAYRIWVSTKSDTRPARQQSANARVALSVARSFGRSSLPQHLINVPKVMLEGVNPSECLDIRIIIDSAIWNAFSWTSGDALVGFPSASFTKSAKAQALMT